MSPAVDAEVAKPALCQLIPWFSDLLRYVDDYFLNVWQRPGFVEDRLFWSVKAEERFKALFGFGGDPGAG